MKENIKKRVIVKVEIVIDRVEFIDEHLSQDILSDRILRKAIYKEFQEAIEAASDLCAMIRRGLNSSAKDDYSNIDFLVERKVVEERLGRRLKEANGLRNRLIHGYDGVNDEIACRIIKEMLADLREFSKAVLEWMIK
jgi:uncharacterized protein YutE (UPF0331/DUF86 family)